MLLLSTPPPHPSAAPSAAPAAPSVLLSVALHTPVHSNLGALLEMFHNAWPEPFMVQPFLPSVSEGDKRIVLVDGVVAGAINRIPGEGEIRSNLAVGGKAVKTDLLIK